MSKKQTAVSYLIEQLLPKALSAEQFYVTQEALKKEREQIEKAYIEGMEFIPVDPNKYTEDAEQYYTQTYQQ